MKDFKTKVKKFTTPLLCAVAITGATTLLFQGLTQAAVMTETEKQDTIPANYSNTYYSDVNTSEYSYQITDSSHIDSKSTDLTLPTKENLPESNYQKANYTLIDNDLEYYQDKKPTDKDISREMAAEIGAKAFWTVFNVDLEDKVLEMSYEPATEDNRAIWQGCYWVNGIGDNSQSYFFSVDSITGELHTVQYIRTLTDEVPLEYNSALAKSPLEYTELAKIVAEKYNVVHGKVKSYNDHTVQGYSSNDPTIDIRVIGENGEQAQIGFSRHDKTLLSIAYDSWCREADATSKKTEEEMKRKYEMQNIEDFEGSEGTILVPMP